MLRAKLVDGSWLLTRAIHGLSWYTILEMRPWKTLKILNRKSVHYLHGCEIVFYSPPPGKSTYFASKCIESMVRHQLESAVLPPSLTSPKKP
jgi:hypothetical protein